MKREQISTASTPTVFFYNGISSALSSLSLRLASMAFNVYLASVAGAGAMGLMSLIYSVWGFALTIGCASGSFCTSRITAKEISTGKDVKGGSSKCVRFACFCGSVTAFALFLLSGAFGRFILSDERCILPLKILALSLPFISMSGSIEGYFNACTRSSKTAVLRICEQASRILLTVALFSLFKTSDPGIACLLIVCAGVVSDILSFFVLLLIFWHDRSKHFSQNGKTTMSYGELASLSLPISLSTSIRSALVSIEHIIIPRKLIEYGMTYSSSLAYVGIIRGMALPTVLFCYALPSAFSGLLMPKIAEYHINSCKNGLSYIAKRAYRLVLCFSVAVSGFLLLFGGMIGDTLFSGQDAGKYIYLLSPLIPVMYIDSVSDAFLKGMDHQVYSMKINIADSLISIGISSLLVPKIGIYGYIVAIYSSEIFNTSASLIKVMSLIAYRIPIVRYLLIPLLTAIISSRVTRWLCGYIYAYLGSTVTLIVGGVLFFFMFCTILRICGNVDKEESGWILYVLTSKQDNKKICLPKEQTCDRQ